jgi:hypothetical protein
VSLVSVSSILVSTDVAALFIVLSSVHVLMRRADSSLAALSSAARLAISVPQPLLLLHALGFYLSKFARGVFLLLHCWLCINWFSSFSRFSTFSKHIGLLLLYYCKNTELIKIQRTSDHTLGFFAAVLAFC